MPLLLTLWLSGQVNLTHVLFPLPRKGLLTLEPHIIWQVIPICLLCFNHTLLPILLPFQMGQHLVSFKGASAPSNMLVGSGKPNTCLISSSSKRFIDSGATYHMTGNFSLFTTFQPHPSTSTVILPDGSTSCVIVSRTVHPPLLITLTSVLSLPQFSFNLIFVSKLTRTLNCNISFFPKYCLI